jgi:hypothetical protein
MGLFSLTEVEVDRVIERVLSNKRVEAIVTHIADKLVDRVVPAVLERIAAGIKADQEG